MLYVLEIIYLFGGSRILDQLWLVVLSPVNGKHNVFNPIVHSVDNRAIVGQYSDQLSAKCHLIFCRCISIECWWCRWYISQLSVVYRSSVGRISVMSQVLVNCVNLAVQSSGFLFKRWHHQLMLSWDGEKFYGVRCNYSMKRIEWHWELGTRF